MQNEHSIITLSGIPFHVRSSPSLQWLKAYGQVQRVLSDGTSGYLEFGVQGDYGRLWIKYAGADPINSIVSPQNAIKSLRETASLYTIRHASLVPVLSHGPVENGYAIVFPWIEEDSLNNVEHPFRTLPWNDSLAMLDSLFELHVQLSQEGLVVGNFSKQHILADFANKRFLLCNLRGYRQRPAQAPTSFSVGDSRYLAPEYLQPGHVLNEQTTVFSLGKLALDLYQYNQLRRKKTWYGPPAILPVALKAAEEDPRRRYQTVLAFLQEWRKMVGQTDIPFLIK